VHRASCEISACRETNAEFLDRVKSFRANQRAQLACARANAIKVTLIVLAEHANLEPNLEPRVRFRDEVHC